jgi:hypothetical protein
MDENCSANEVVSEISDTTAGDVWLLVEIGGGAVFRKLKLRHCFSFW